jgi:hypothetical protein
MGLVNLIYGSSATNPMTEQELVDLLIAARAKNTRLNVTGMLLYRGGNFLQVLEGERHVVEDLYQTIRRDPRHRQVEFFAARDIRERLFTDWSMGFVHLDTFDPTTVPGYSNFLNEPLNSDRFRNPNFALSFMQVFRDEIR